MVMLSRYNKKSVLTASMPTHGMLPPQGHRQPYVPNAGAARRRPYHRNGNGKETLVKACEGGLIGVGAF